MRIIVVSDTHGRLGDLQEAIERSEPIDWLLHLGDIVGQQEEIAMLAGKARVAMVEGNNDFFSGLQKELELEIGGIKILMTHGHRYGVYQGFDRLKELGLLRGADVVMFGHTHCPHLEVDEESGITLLNPGSVSYPRQSGRQCTYAVMDVSGNKKVNYEIKYL